MYLKFNVQIYFKLLWHQTVRALKLTISNVNKESDSVSLWASLESSQKNVRKNSGGYTIHTYILCT